MISGLHSCNPKNTPYTGDVKTFVVIDNPARDGKKAWTKIKSASTDQGGRPYEIMSVAKTDYTDQYGNHSFNLEIVPVEISDKRTEPARPLQDGGNDVVRVVGYEDRGNRIERQHSQEMAIRYAALKGLKDITPKDMVALIDWFARDVSRTPAPPKMKAKSAPEPVEDEASPMGDGVEEEF